MSELYSFYWMECKILAVFLLLLSPANSKSLLVYCNYYTIVKLVISL